MRRLLSQATAFFALLLLQLSVSVASYQLDECKCETQYFPAEETSASFKTRNEWGARCPEGITCSFVIEPKHGSFIELSLDSVNLDSMQELRIYYSHHTNSDDGKTALVPYQL